MQDALGQALDRLAFEADLICAIRAGWDALAILSSNDAARRADTAFWAVTRRPAYSHDYLYRAFALLALGKIRSDHAQTELVRALLPDGLPTQAYAAAGLRQRVEAETVTPLVSLLRLDDGVTRAAVQRALLTAPYAVGDEVEHGLIALAFDGSPSTRVSAIECLSRRPASIQVLTLFRRLASSRSEPEEVRGAAIRALGDMGDLDALAILEQPAYGDDGMWVQIAAAEALGEFATSRSSHVLLDVVTRPGTPAAVREAASVSLRRVVPRADPITRGLVIAQVAMHGSADPGLRSVGTGESGGLATLTDGLARALGRHPDVARLYTVVRTRLGQTDEENVPAEPVGSQATVQLPVGSVDALPAADMWSRLFQIERGLERFFNTQPHLDAIHLRFADAGTWAAAQWAKRRGVPIVFTLAPDPYVPMQAAVRAGVLNRYNFADADRQQQLLARSGVLEWMSRHADRLALLPRPSWHADGRAFFGTDLTRQSSRVRVVAEGIDVLRAKRARMRLETEGVSVHARFSHASAPGWGTGLAPHRTGRPVLVSVGRLHPIKGMARLAKIWANSDNLRERFNLLIIGGNLDEPTHTEQKVLDQISATMKMYPEAAGGLLLPGNLPHNDVAVMLAALRKGISGLTEPHAIYVCASDKEEFGLAILEAMAAELLVVAPVQGGPATYLEDGCAGFLADTQDPRSLEEAIGRAASVRADEQARERMQNSLRNIVFQRYSVDRMANDLVALYQPGSAATVRSAS